MRLRLEVWALGETKLVILYSRHQKVKLLSSELFLYNLYTPPISLCSVLDNHLTNYSKP